MERPYSLTTEIDHTHYETKQYSQCHEVSPPNHEDIPNRQPPRRRGNARGIHPVEILSEGLRIGESVREDIRGKGSKYETEDEGSVSDDNVSAAIVGTFKRDVVPNCEPCELVERRVGDDFHLGVVGLNRKESKDRQGAVIGSRFKDKDTEVVPERLIEEIVRVIGCGEIIPTEQIVHIIRCLCLVNPRGLRCLGEGVRQKSQEQDESQPDRYLAQDPLLHVQPLNSLAHVQ